MKLINSENNKFHIFFTAQSPCAIILINHKCPCIYLLIGCNDCLDPLVNVEGVTSISTISLVDVDVGSFSSYIYQPTPWAKHTKTTIWGAPSLGNPSCSKLYFSPLSLAVAVVAALPSSAILFSATSKAVYHVPTDLQCGRVLFLFLFLATEQIDSYSCPRSQRLSPLVPAILTLSHAVCPHACNHPLRLPARDACLRTCFGLEQHVVYLHLWWVLL